MLDTLTTWHRSRGVARELSRLSDRALADLGLARSDIPAVAGIAAGARRETRGTMAPAWGRHVQASVAI